MIGRTTVEGFDGVIRTITSSLLALTLVGALVYWLLTNHDNPPEYLIALASSVCSFYMGGHASGRLNGNNHRRHENPQVPSAKPTEGGA